ncbi:MAG: hypothetical protein OEM52_12370 [bacterium]|nr:hypothetical protein [bacterium]
MTRWFRKSAPLEERLRIVTERFQQSFGPSLRCILLYGSALGTNWSSEHSDVNLVVEFDQEDTAALDLAVGLRPILQQHNINCQWFNKDGIIRAADVFPIELLDLKLHRKVLFGIDPMEEVAIYPSDLRLACERLARERLLTLRTSYIACAGDEKLLRSLLLKSAPTWSALFQAVLYLTGTPVPTDLRERAAIACEKLGFEAGAFLALYEWRIAPNSGDSAFLMQLLRSYVRSVKQLVEFLDQWSEV